MAFYFCPKCGEYRRLKSFMLVKVPTCPECNKPLEETGTTIMLFSIFVSLFLCAGATEAAKVTFLGFSALAVVRWFRQSQIRKKHVSKQTLEVADRKRAES